MHVYNAQRGQLGLHIPEKLLVDNFAGGGGASLGIARCGIITANTYFSGRANEPMRYFNQARAAA